MFRAIVAIFIVLIFIVLIVVEHRLSKILGKLSDITYSLKQVVSTLQKNRLE